jgi:hypothetical protein
MFDRTRIAGLIPSVVEWDGRIAWPIPSMVDWLCIDWPTPSLEDDDVRNARPIPSIAEGDGRIAWPIPSRAEGVADGGAALRSEEMCTGM